MNFILALQGSGYIASLVTLILYCTGRLTNPFWFALSFSVHTTGDLLFFFFEKPKNMSFLDNLDSYVKLPSFLQFVGLMGGFGALYFSHATGPKVVGFLSLGIAMAGFVYNQIYQ